MNDFIPPYPWALAMVDRNTFLFDPRVMDALEDALGGGGGGSGEDGREVELQANATHIQWRYVGDPTWIDLVALEDLKGPPGDDGVDATLTTYADMAAVDAVTTTELGVVTVASYDTALGASTIPDSEGGDMLIETIRNTSATDYTLMQVATVTWWETPTERKYVRTRGNYGGTMYPWGAWSAAASLPSVSPDATTARALVVSQNSSDVSFQGMGSAASALTVMLRDVNGRSKVAPPAAADDVARLDTYTGGMKNYGTSTAALDAETTTCRGILSTDWAAYASGVVFNHSGAAIVETVASTQSSTAILTQRAFIGSSSSVPSGQVLSRRKVGAGAWSAWSGRSYTTQAPTITDQSNQAMTTSLFWFAMLGLGLARIANWAALDAYDGDSATGAVESPESDLGTYLGMPAYAGMWPGYVQFEHYSGAYYPDQTRMQRLKFPNKTTGELVTVERRRAWTAPAAMPAWSAWAVI